MSKEKSLVEVSNPEKLLNGEMLSYTDRILINEVCQRALEAVGDIQIHHVDDLVVPFEKGGGTTT